ncbi:beta-propeller domain-containing protein [Phytoactinopolyspora limicola]|uniref:beta-propeller domain-containing protein n=1 Tax=Phytoactinopolyspora limicola TaxID=2715536 RepID=UPI0014087466|nr:beta-propeller domain-containing protein [Phytoactinopolyspora limicola]
MRKRLAFVLGCGIAVGTLGVINVLPANEAAATGLISFGTCSEALDHLRGEARERVGPWGLHHWNDAAIAMESDGTEAASDDALSGAAPGGSPSHSTTNVQEVGVDEPDVVKTDGRLIVTTSGSTLRVIDVTGSEPEQLGELSISDDWAETRVLLSGDRALVFAWEHAMIMDDDASYPAWDPMRTAIHLVDLSEPTAPVIESSLRVDGNYLDARLIDDTVRVVISSPPTLRFPVMDYARDEDQMRDTMRDTIDESTVEDWLPSYSLTAADGTETGGLLVECDQLNHPGDFAGYSTVSVLTLGFDELSDGSAVGVLTDGDTVYASADLLYVATAKWGDPIEPTTSWGTGDDAVTDDETMIDIDPMIMPWPQVESTGIHAFDIRGDDPAEYLASGEVDGAIIGRYAMSEHEGVLRVATTTDANDAKTSESHLYTLGRQGRDLVRLGHVGGLGAGERIYAVRYFGDTGYVVTFRQIDPLYVLDLSDPATPTVDGELKITGYSSYLHRVGDDRLVGIGQEATDTGRTVGSQVSLFDVGNPVDPRKLDGHVMENAWSDAEHNPHAFLFWQPTGQLVIPVSGMDLGGRDLIAAEDSGALVLKLTGDALQEQGVVTRRGPTEDHYWTTITRSLVIGDSLYTLWDDGLQVNNLDDLEFQSWLPIDTDW